VAWLNTPLRYHGTRATALHAAVDGGFADAVQALVDAGADVNMKDGQGTPPLQRACDVEVARILLDAGAGRADKGRSSIALACEDPSRIEVLRLLLQRFPNPESRKQHYPIDAARFNNLEAVCALLDTRPHWYINISLAAAWVAELTIGCYSPEATPMRARV
jgi:ankyrin repeat protein